MSHYQPYSEDEIYRAVHFRMNGVHPREIAVTLSRSETTINRLLSIEKKKHNYRYPAIRLNVKWTRERIEALAYDYKREGKYRKVAESNGLSPQRLSFLMAKRAHGLQAGEWRI